VRVRAAEPRDVAAWAAFRAELWPEEDAEHLETEAQSHFLRPLYAAVLVAEAGDGALLGMIEIQLRSVAEGARSSPVPYVEAWYVAPSARRQGIGRALVSAAEGWARAQGFDELCSDALLDNAVSHAAHAALGFREVERLVVFHKPLRG
jgi:aminoglycoside 6'-N-acetyltransferase I